MCRTDPSVDFRPCFILLNFRCCSTGENTLLTWHWFFTNVSKDGDTERCWHACENVSLKRSLLLNKSSRTISLYSRSLSRHSDNICAIYFSNTRNTSFTFACALSLACMLARSLSLNHVECTD